MIIKIHQTQSNGKNLYEISDESGVLFHARAPWLEINLPFNADNLRKLSMTDPAGQIVYTTKYSVLENVLEGALPLKYLWTGEQRFRQYSIHGRDGVVGSFYGRVNGFFDGKCCIENNGRIILGYSVSKGSYEVVCFYDGEKQIAQLTKYHVVSNNLDQYYLHILDDCRDLVPILSFFAIYYDYHNYNNGGELVYKKTEVRIKYTYSKANRYYDPNWIACHFGEAEALRLREELERLRGDAMKKVKRAFKIAAIVFAAVMAVIVPVVITLLIVLL